MIYKVLQNLENRGMTEKTTCKQTACSGGRGSSLSMRQWTMITSAWQKLPKNWELTRLMFGECLNEKGWSITKEDLPKQTAEKARDPTVEALLEAYDPDVRRAINHCPGCNGWGVIFHKHKTFGRFFFPERKGAREVGNPYWPTEKLQMTPAEINSCERWTKMLSDRLCRRLKHAWGKLFSSRGFWYFEHLILADKSAQMQSLTQIDGFYHRLVFMASVTGDLSSHLSTPGVGNLQVILAISDRQTHSWWGCEGSACVSSSPWWIGYRESHRRFHQGARLLKGHLPVTDDLDKQAGSRLGRRLLGHQEAKEGSLWSAHEIHLRDGSNCDTHPSGKSAVDRWSRSRSGYFTLAESPAPGSPRICSTQRSL